MSKRIKNAVLAAALASVVAISGAASACTVKTSHPRAKITISFNEKTYDLEYTLYRTMYPQTRASITTRLSTITGRTTG